MTHELLGSMEICGCVAAWKKEKEKKSTSRTPPCLGWKRFVKKKWY